jgi:uncharacterized membrane protein
MKPKTSSSRPFIINLFIILGVVTLIAIGMSLLNRDVSAASNTYFLGSFLLWIVAVIPIISEISSNTKIRIKARKEGKSAKKQIIDHEDKYQQGGRITFLFGIAGFICFILAFLLLTI